MPCLADFFQTKDGSQCHIHKKYIEAGEGGQRYHGEKCGGCPWWEDTEEDKEFFARLRAVGMKRIGVREKPRVYPLQQRMGESQDTGVTD